MRLAAIDTSGTHGSIAFYDGKSVLAEAGWDKKAMHSEMATSEFQTTAKAAGLELKDLTHLAVNVGPGSFTGLRVGINLTRTLAYVFNLKVAGLNTLEILAHRDAPNERTFVAIKAVQNFYYAAIYEDGKQILAPQSVDEENLNKVSTGCTKVLIEGLSQGFDSSTSALDMISLLDRGDAGPRFLSWREVKPLYVRASEAEEKLLKGLLKPL
jgi:tRNA threonylcarbamoyl adenosine modification protein YeaZ